MKLQEFINVISNLDISAEGKSTLITIYRKLSQSAISVDDNLNDSSVNPVQNKIITAALNDKQPVGDYATEQYVLDKVAEATGVDLTKYATKEFVREGYQPIGDYATNEGLRGKVDKDGDKVLSDNNYTDIEKQKLADLNNYDDAELRNAIIDINNSKGQSNGLATLNDKGCIPSSQLPSFVDDVIELIVVKTKGDIPGGEHPIGDKYYVEDEKKIYTFVDYEVLDNGANPEGSTIYVNNIDNKAYRWSGSDLILISDSIALGETTGTAYEGSKGKQNAIDIAALKKEKQELLVSGENIKTINGIPVLGKGNIPIEFPDIIEEAPNDQFMYARYQLGWKAITDGKDGKEIELRKGETAIQWRYTTETLWEDLIPLKDLVGPIGPVGPQGIPGKDGADGKDGTSVTILDSYNTYEELKAVKEK